MASPGMSVCYDLRLFNRRGAAILFYQVMCATPQDATARIASLDALPYSRVEVWRGEDLVHTLSR